MALSYIVMVCVGLNNAVTKYRMHRKGTISIVFHRCLLVVDRPSLTTFRFRLEFEYVRCKVHLRAYSTF